MSPHSGIATETFSGGADSRRGEEAQLNINVVSSSGLSDEEARAESKQRRTIELQYPGQPENMSGGEHSVGDNTSVLGSKMIVYYEYIDPETG